MKALGRDQDTPLFVPDFIADSVLDINFAELHKHGVRYIAFDADSTLVAYRAKALSLETQNLLRKELVRFEGVCVASNRITNDLADIAESINAEVIRASLTMRKPAKSFFRRVVTHFGAKPDKIAMIGDKLVADIYGGNRAGFKTVWVAKKGRDGLLDRWFQTRKIEQRMMRRYLGELYTDSLHGN